jgi:hypothetical protein
VTSRDVRVSLPCPLMAQHSVQIGIGIKFDGQNQDGFPGQNQVFCGTFRLDKSTAWYTSTYISTYTILEST